MTPRLILRRPTLEDAQACFLIHGDPVTNRFNPAGPDADLAASERRLSGWLAGWDARGIGYWIAHERQIGRLVGFGGVAFMQWRDREILNLYYRLAPAMWGRGYAAELGMRAVGLGLERWPDTPIVGQDMC